MAQRRKVNNLLALAVLATVIQQPMHPYEMASVLRERGKDRDMKIKWGSLYTVVANLEKHGLVTATESVRQGGRPERTVYAITDAGRVELADWVQELLANPEPEQSKFQAALSVMTALPPTVVVALLRERSALLDDRVAGDRAFLAQAGAGVPRLFLIEEEYALAMLEAELAWVRSVLAELESGSFPGLELWQQYHDTGELPADVRELANKGTDKNEGTDK